MTGTRLLPESTNRSLRDMTSEEARELLHLLARIGGYLNQSTAFVQDHDSDEEFQRYRTLAGHLMGDLYSDGMEPLFRRFPELRPDYLGGPYTIPREVYLPLFYSRDQPPLTPSPKAPSLPP